MNNQAQIVYTYLVFTVEQINSFDLRARFREVKGDINTENKEKSDGETTLSTTGMWLSRYDF